MNLIKMNLNLSYTAYDYDQNVVVKAGLIFDAQNRRTRTLNDIKYFNQSAKKYDVIDLYKENIQYVYDFDTKYCAKFKFEQPWVSYDVPDNATFLGEGYLGSSAFDKAYLLVNSWKYDFIDEYGYATNYTGSWTDQLCLPVWNVYSSPGRHINTHATFFDFVLGIYLNKRSQTNIILFFLLKIIFILEKEFKFEFE